MQYGLPAPMPVQYGLPTQYGLSMLMQYGLPMPVQYGLSMLMQYGLPMPVQYGLPMPTPTQYRLSTPTQYGLPMPMQYGLPVLTPMQHGLPVPTPMQHGLAVPMPMQSQPAMDPASTSWAEASSKDIARKVQWSCQANHIRNITCCGLWPVPDDEVVSILLPLPNIYVHPDYLGRLDELEAAWKCQGLHLSGYEDHVLDAHRPMTQLTKVVSLDNKGLVSAEGVKSRFCLALSSRQRIWALGTMVAMRLSCYISFVQLPALKLL